MGGRNTYAAGKNAPFTYNTVGFFHGIKVLEGLGGKHGLPEEAHSSNAYVQLANDGSLKKLRFYDKDKYLVLEIGFHAVPELTGHRNPVYHIHEYNRDNFKDRPPRLFTKEDIEKFGKYLTLEGHLK